MSNKQNLGDLNGYLFEALDTISNPDLSGDELKAEIDRARTVSKLAQSIISNGNLALRAAEFKDEALSSHPDVPKMLEG